MTDTPEATAAATAAAAAGSTAPDATAPEAAAVERIAQLEAEVASMKDQALRALAEAENLRRRTEREKEDAQKYAIARFAKDLLSVADNLRRAIDAAPAEGTDEATRNLVDGVAATERELTAVFERFGVRKVDPAAGDRFDPNLHEALFEMPSDAHPGGSVLQVVRAGYTIHDRLLRAAQVGVAKAGEAPVQRVDTTA
ncbi:MAG: nucleotide exchange factor GrpE [Alphaproteobacteria bacterium]|nr:nucleotide exchange factor GrpE [Alphaproteobacteria bacterium]TAD91992.1 MAG: nucleotide exchange factor GrpE [Alphaproteobacteria bacterium]